MTDKVREKGGDGNGAPSTTDAVDSALRVLRGEIPAPPSYGPTPDTETARLAALIIDEAPGFSARVRWNHEHDGYPATMEHLRLAREIMTLLVDAISESYDPDGVLSRLAAARKVLLNPPEGTELLARYALFIGTTHRRYVGAEPGLPLTGRELLRLALRTLAEQLDPAFAGLPFERFERAIAGISTSAHPEAEGVYRVAADLAISVGAFGLDARTDARKYAARLRTYAGRHK